MRKKLWVLGEAKQHLGAPILLGATRRLASGKLPHEEGGALVSGNSTTTVARAQTSARSTVTGVPTQQPSVPSGRTARHGDLQQIPAADQRHRVVA